jgi:HSP20 family molecular chaperone IbpA
MRKDYLGDAILSKGFDSLVDELFDYRRSKWDILFTEDKDNNKYIVEIALPGVEKENIKVMSMRSAIKLKILKGSNYVSRGEQVIRFPKEIDESKTKVKIKNGVLKIIVTLKTGLYKEITIE